MVALVAGVVRAQTVLIKLVAMVAKASSSLPIRQQRLPFHWAF